MPRNYFEDEVNEEEEDSADQLTNEEIEYLMDLINGDGVAQEDVELALTLLRHHTPAMEPILDQVTSSAPHLLRKLYAFIGQRKNDGDILSTISAQIQDKSNLDEYDLFWYAKIVIDYFDFNQTTADKLIEIYQHARATAPVKALILETPNLNHGFADFKVEELRSNRGPLCMASVLLGLKELEKGRRNQLFKYVERQGAMLGVLARIASRI